RPTELKVTLATGQTKTLLSGATYYPFGPVSKWTYGNGRILRRSLNQNYQSGFVEDTTTGGISEGYSFDAAGNLESLRKADQLDPARRTYGYDGLNRLTQVRDGVNSAVLQAYAYDKTGNRTSRTDEGVTTAYTYGPARHRLTQIGQQSRLYDSAGNTTRIDRGGNTDTLPPVDPGGPPGTGTTARSALLASSTARAASATAAVREFVYDDANRMRQVKHDGVVAMNYLYNGKGEQVHKTGSSKTVVTVYDEAGHWIADYDAYGNAIQQVIWLDNLPVGLLVDTGANQKLYYIEAASLGTPRVVIDPDRNVAVWNWSLVNEAFGDSAPNEDPDADGIAFVFDMRMPGQRWDSATGMSYNYFRDYDASVGRYVQSDPIGLDGGISTYGYVGSNPLLRSDPLGLEDSLTAKVNAALIKGDLLEAITIARAGATPAAAALATKYQQLYNVVQGYLSRAPLALNRCEIAAKNIYDIFRYNGLSPQYLRIANAPGFRFVYISERYTAPQHFSVRLGERVFDATTGPSGMLYSEYVARLNALNLGPGSYLIQTINDIEGYL
ncbi:MAG: RHS repeat-associated core domain-containing protein, partial [Lysobacteraceae bacterium]